MSRNLATQSLRAAALVAAALAVSATPSQAQAPAAGAAPPAPPATAVQTTGTVAANLNITPKRLTFSKGRRVATVFVYNQGNAEGTFDVTLVDRAMLPDGQIVPVDDALKRPDGKDAAAKVKSAQSYILVSPRRITLAPGKGQTVRIRVSEPPADGSEYRSHLTVTTIPPRTAGVTADAAAAATGPAQMRFQINALFGLSIPLIVRTADPDVRATIQNPKFESVSEAGVSTPVLTFDLVRNGTSSLFGNIEVRKAGDTRGDPLGLARGVGLYPEIERRVITIPLSRRPAPGEKVDVTFIDDDTSPGKVIAKSTAP